MKRLIKYDNFLEKFTKKDKCFGDSNVTIDHKLLNELSSTLGGYSFNDGVFLIYSDKEILEHTRMLEEAFPNAKGKVYSFGRDWLNRYFAIFKDEPSSTVLLFDLNFDEVLDLEMDLISFFEQGLIEYTNDILAEDFFNSWKDKSKIKLNCQKCVAYKTLPILGGEDEIDNLELVDANWSFEMNTLLVKKVRNLDEGEKIGKVEIE